MKMSGMKKAGSSRKGKCPQEKQFCNYVHRVCMQNRLEGYDYCIRHILEDKTAPFKQCSFVHPQNGKRCTNAAPKSEKRDSLCPFHTKKLHLNVKPPKVKKTIHSPKSILEALEHYCAGPHDSQNANWDYSTNNNGTHTNFSLSRFAGREADSDSEREVTLVDQTWRKSIDSDNESVDSEQDDPLKHAGVYTAEEVASITRDKLIKLQSLYIDQFKRLQHILKEKRRIYLHNVKAERDSLGPIQHQPNDVTYQKLKALQRYHRVFGKEAILKSQYKEKRLAVTEGSNYHPPSYPKCVFQQDGHRCAARTIPLSKYCRKHSKEINLLIDLSVSVLFRQCLQSFSRQTLSKSDTDKLINILSDPNQVLFKSCNGENGDCAKPIIPYHETTTCVLHTPLSAPPSGKGLSWSEGSQGQEITAMETDSLSLEPEHFQSMDDIASLGLDVVQPGSLFGLNQFGEPGESTDSALSGDQTGDLIQTLSLNSADILDTSRKSLEQDVDK